MPFPRKRSPVQFSEQEMLKLESIRKSRTEEKRRTLRAAFLLDSLSGQSDEAIAQHYHVSRSTVCDWALCRYWPDWTCIAGE